MGDQRKDDRREGSWTEKEAAPSEVIEILPIRSGRILAGRYAIDQIIGRGGSGVVVRAHDRDLRAEVAIKIVRAELAGQRVWTERLAREVRLARQINHPNVCRVFDFEQADGRAFLVMELADGGTLRDEIRSGAQAARPIAKRIADARAVAWALDAIHRAGIVHRDLSPQNVLRMGDGRLVLSDFGLAVDVSESTSSVHGGTVAYMAPEIFRGGRATFASDIWGLGVVIYELVFGVKPRWSEALGGRMLPPELGRPLLEEERAVLEACRACTAVDPAHRIARPAEVAVMLVARRRSRRLRQLARVFTVRRPLVLAVALTVMAALAMGLFRARHRARDATSSSDSPQSPLVVPTGVPADWTDVSTVIAEVPDRIHCTRLLPDQKTIRFVWGSPPRAEDIDIVTRKRVPAPLVPAAYAEGCPDLSPDGKHLLYQGHSPDGRAYAFLSDRPDGKDGVPVVQTAEPSMSSEPTWLADGRSITYDIDAKHPGVFSLDGGHTKVMPEPIGSSFITAFRFAEGDLIFVSAVRESGTTELVAYSWPSLQEQIRFRTSDLILDVRRVDSTIYYAEAGLRQQKDLVALEETTHVAHRVGWIAHQIIRYPTFVKDDLIFASLRSAPDLYAMSKGGLTRLTSSGDVFSAARCGADFIICREKAGKTSVERLGKSGTSAGVVVADSRAISAGCSEDGKTVYYVDGSSWALERCDPSGCRKLVDRPAMSIAVSPDGKRIAVLTVEKRGIVIWWVSFEGGKIHEVAETDNPCHPRWASANTLWISRRVRGNPIWTEVDADTGRETGKVVPGLRDCSDGRPDPGSPGEADLRIINDQKSQLRLLDRKFLRPR